MGVLRTWRELRTMDEGGLLGNIMIHWNKENSKEVAVAEETFERYLKAGWMACKLEASEERRVQIFNFDPNLPIIILLPPVGGG